jgi:hypothetical protein
VDGLLRPAALLLALFAATGSGCAKKDSGVETREMSRVRILTNLHAMATTKIGHLPRDEQEFKQAIAKLQVNLEKRKAGSIDELFISERDGQPLVVIYGSGSVDSDVVVYEQNGVNGKRMVGHRIGMVEEVDESELKKLTASKH